MLGACGVNMCGIAGYIVTNGGTVRKRKLKLLAQSLLLGISERGKEAAGYAYVHPQTGFVRIAKEGVSPIDFVKIPGHLLSTGDHQDMPRAMILHARFPTQGSVRNNENNHPLYSKGSGLCMVHNGWFTNEAEVAKAENIEQDGEVDSEVYLKLIERYAQGCLMDTAIEKATQQLDGTSACAMIQAKKPNQLWLWRDNFGSLSVAETEFGFVFASTPGILYAALFASLTAFDSTTLGNIPLDKGELLLLSDAGVALRKKLALGTGEFHWSTRYENGVKVRQKVDVGANGQVWWGGE